MHHRLARVQRCSLAVAVALCALPAIAAADGARTPAAFAAALARYDAAPPGPARDALAAEVDTAAAQRYATVSRLYWYTDLAQAKAAARAQAKPIFALRMLGRLDEELSCANSRFFRTALYANTELSALLREHFILYWSSERPAPKVTIDFGDGRTITRTATGNSAHYVLDENGDVIEVFPGLYAPAVLKQRLADTLAFARELRRTAPAKRLDRILSRELTQTVQAQARWREHSRMPAVKDMYALLTDPQLSMLARAQNNTASKAVVEVPDLDRTTPVKMHALDERELAQWSALGQIAFDIRGDRPQVLDEPSRALIARIFTAGPLATTPEQTAQVIARFEQHIVADTALNEFRLRTEIRTLLAKLRTRDFDRVNAAIYAEVFVTPRSDDWVGLLSRTDFTGLPGDGVALP